MLNKQIFRILHAYQLPMNFIFFFFAEPKHEELTETDDAGIYTHMCVGGVCVHSLTHPPMYIYIFLYMERIRESLFQM